MLLVGTNLAVMVVLSIVASLLGVNRYLAANGLDFGALLAFCAVMGFGGAFISLLMSKTIAKWSTGAQVIGTPRNNAEYWLVETVRRLAKAAGLPAMPEVAIYDGPPNAFATGATKGSSLVAVSTGLLQGMTKEEVEAVLAHEISHIANGDMVTLTLIQGVMNTFVYFLSRVVGFMIDSFLRRGGDRSGIGIGYSLSVIVLDILFGILAGIVVAWFSRQREFRADAGAAKLAGSPRTMIAALQRLGNMHPEPLPSNMASSGIAGKGGIASLFATHPSLDDRIEALRRQG
jgi:heat shock protein HtpX